MNDEKQARAGIDKKGRAELLRQLMALALPVALQSMLGFAVNLLDTVMLGSLGEVPISASSLSNQLFFILSLLIYGVVGGSNVLVAQFWGNRDTASIHKVLAITYRIALLGALAATAAGLFLPKQVLSIFTDDSAVIEAGIGYLRIVALTYLFYTITTVTCGTLRSVRDVKISVLLSAVSLAINAALNYILIFGHFGAPALGIVGAAIATSVARAAECLLLILYAAFKEERLHIRFKTLLRVDKSIVKRYFRTALPVIANELFWAVGASMLAVIMGRMGTEFVAANSIFSVTSQIAGVLYQGLSAAAAVMIGNAIGAGEHEKLAVLKRQLQWIGLSGGAAAALIVLALRPLMLDLYNISEITLAYTNQIMWTGAVIQIFRGGQVMNMMGILRGGGDAKFVMANDLVFLWTLAVPLGFLAGLVWKLPIPAVYCILNIEQFLKLFTSAARLRGNKWVKNVTVS